VGTQGWGTIPIVAFGCFCMLGILSIAYEIENPFGYDDNDLVSQSICTN
jgi:putative membrane protein